MMKTTDILNALEKDRATMPQSTQDLHTQAIEQSSTSFISQFDVQTEQQPSEKKT